jgi:hypothetical protein
MNENRKKAYNLIRICVARRADGISLSDLSDSSILCNGLDNLQAAIELCIYSPEDLIDIADDVAQEVLEDEGFYI